MDIGSPEFTDRVRAKDPVALREAVDACLPQVLRAARAAGLGEQEAEDIAQETFLTFLGSLERFEGRSTVRTWIFGILYRKVSEERRRSQRQDLADDIDEVVEARFDTHGSWVRPPRPPDESLFDQQIMAHLDTCLEGLSGPQQMCFVLREVEGLASDEICEIAGVTRTNLGVLLHRARNSLRECLERRGFSRNHDARLA